MKLVIAYLGAQGQTIDQDYCTFPKGMGSEQEIRDWAKEWFKDHPDLPKSKVRKVAVYTLAVAFDI